MKKERSSKVQGTISKGLSRGQCSVCPLRER